MNYRYTETEYESYVASCLIFSYVSERIQDEAQRNPGFMPGRSLYAFQYPPNLSESSDSIL